MTRTDGFPVRRRPDGSLDIDFHTTRATVMRKAEFGRFMSLAGKLIGLKRPIARQASGHTSRPASGAAPNISILPEAR